MRPGSVPARLLQAALLLVLTSCARDFSLPDPTQAGLRELTVSPTLVGPGDRLEIGLTLEGPGQVEVTVNARPAERVPSLPGRLSYRYEVRGDEGEVLIVQVVVELGGEQLTETRTVALDAVAPGAPLRSALLLLPSAPGEPDRLAGLGGLVGDADLARVVVAADPGGTLRLAESEVAGDGAFEAMEVGDNTAARLHVSFVDRVGNVGPATVVENDVREPVLGEVVFWPTRPRAGLPFELRLRFDETLGTSPEGRLVGAGDLELPLSFELTDDGTQVAAGVMALGAGRAELHLLARDAAENLASIVRSFEVLAPGHIDPERVVLRRAEGQAWEILGLSGAAPFPGSIEARGPDGAVLGAQVVASDGSFSIIDLAGMAGEVVDLLAYDPEGLLLSEVSVSPDVVGPVVLRVEVTPTVAGPGQTVQIEIEGDENLGEGTRVKVGGRPALRDATVPGRVARYTYAVVGDEPSGHTEVLVEVADLAGNNGEAKRTTTILDNESPSIEFRLPGQSAAYVEPWPAPSVAEPPAEVAVTLADKWSTVVSAAWKAERLRTGQVWNGSAWMPPGSLGVDHPISSPAILAIPGDLAVPQDERVRIVVTATDGAGNVGTHEVRFSRYGQRAWHDAHPGPQASPGSLGVTLGAARMPGGGLCIGHNTYRDASGAYDPEGGEATLLATPDGGDTWRTSTIPIVPVAGDPMPWALAFKADGSLGLLVGTAGLVVRVAPDCSYAGLGDLGTTADAQAVLWAGDTAWIATKDGLYRSDDDGRTWARSGNGVVQALYGLARPRPGLILAAGTGGVVLRSADDGDTWDVRSLGGGGVVVDALAAEADGTLRMTGLDPALPDDPATTESSDQSYFRASAPLDGGMSWAPLPAPNWVWGEDWRAWRMSPAPGGMCVRFNWPSFWERSRWFFRDAQSGTWSPLATDYESSSWPSRAYVWHDLLLEDRYFGWLVGIEWVDTPEGERQHTRVRYTVSGGNL